MSIAIDVIYKMIWFISKARDADGVASFMQPLVLVFFLYSILPPSLHTVENFFVLNYVVRVDILIIKIQSLELEFL